MKARIAYYEADGCQGDPMHYPVLHGRTFDDNREAYQAIIDHIGRDYGSWSDARGNCCYHESDADGCGGFCIEVMDA